MLFIIYCMCVNCSVSKLASLINVLALTSQTSDPKHSLVKLCSLAHIYIHKFKKATTKKQQSS